MYASFHLLRIARHTFQTLLRMQHVELTRLITHEERTVTLIVMSFVLSKVERIAVRNQDEVITCYENTALQKICKRA